MLTTTSSAPNDNDNNGSFVASSTAAATKPADDDSLPLPLVIYNAFAGPRPTPWLVVPAAVYALIALIGIPLNGTVVYVTIRSKTLRGGTCPYLLALVSLFEVGTGKKMSQKFSLKKYFHL
jgi:hypothetical protein